MYVILIYTDIFAEFRAARLDAQMEKGRERTQPSSDPDGGDAYPCPEDDEFFDAPDAKCQVSRRRTAFCIRSGRSSCGAIPTSARVNLLRCVFVHGIYIVYTNIYYVYCSI